MTDADHLPKDTARALGEGEQNLLVTGEPSQVVTVAPSSGGTQTEWLVVRFPFTARVRGWFDAEVAALGRRRATSSGTRPR